MRIVPDDVKPIPDSLVLSSLCNYYWESDTVEITDAEWEMIWGDYKRDCCIEDEDVGLVPDKKSFPQYLRELIELKRER